MSKSKSYSIEDIYNIFISFFDQRKDRYEIKEQLTKWNKKYPGLIEIFEQKEKVNKEQAFEKALEITNRLGELFDPINKDLCKKCANSGKGHSCCERCFTSNAHFSGLGSRNEARKMFINLQLKYGWNEQGFLSENGCLLPREHRSLMCQEHVCDKMLKMFNDQQIKEIQTLRSNLRKIKEDYFELI